MGGVLVGRGGWVSVQSMGEMRKDFCPNFLQPFLENIDRRNCNDGSRELIQVFHNPHRKCRPSPSAVARTLEYLEGVPSYAASSGRKGKQVWINIQRVGDVTALCRNSSSAAVSSLLEKEFAMEHDCASQLT